MDIYEATQALLTEALPGANVTYYLLTYDEQREQFELPAFPAVTYLYSNQTAIVCQGYPTGLYRVMLDVEIWGALEDVSRLADDLNEAVNAKRITVENVVFTIIVQESRDIYDMGLDFHHRLMRFGGLVEIDEVEDDESR